MVGTCSIQVGSMVHQGFDSLQVLIKLNGCRKEASARRFDSYTPQQTKKKIRQFRKIKL